MVSRCRVFTVLAQVAVPKSWSAQELHLRDARDVRHYTTARALHPRTTSLCFKKMCILLNLSYSEAMKSNIDFYSGLITSNNSDNGLTLSVK